MLEKARALFNLPPIKKEQEMTEKELYIRQQIKKYESEDFVKKAKEKIQIFREKHHESPKYIVVPKWLIYEHIKQMADFLRCADEGRNQQFCGLTVIESPAILDLDDIIVL